MQTIAVGEFKAKCLGLMTEVNSTGTSSAGHQARSAIRAGLACGGAGGKRKPGGDLWIHARHGDDRWRYTFPLNSLMKSGRKWLTNGGSEQSEELSFDLA